MSFQCKCNCSRFVWKRDCHLRIYSTIRVGASKFLGVQRIFAQISPNLPKKLFSNFCWPFFGVASKNGLHLIFCKRWAPFLPRFSGILPWISMILPKFSGIFPKFPTNQNFWGCTFTPAPPPPTPLYSTLIVGLELSLVSVRRTALLLTRSGIRIRHFFIYGEPQQCQSLERSMIGRYIFKYIL